MTARPSCPRPRPLTKNMTHLEDKFDSLVKMARDAKPFYKSFENGMQDAVHVAEISGVMLMAQKRVKTLATTKTKAKTKAKTKTKAKAIPRLPSEVWHYMLTEFGGIKAEEHQHVGMMFLPYPTPKVKPVFSAAYLWELYTTQTKEYKESVSSAEECCNFMKRYMRII